MRIKQTPINPVSVAIHWATFAFSLSIKGDITEIKIGAPASAAATALKGKFLIIHGSGDDNVHVQNTMRMVEELIQADKQFEWMIYPDKNHGIYGGNTRKHLYSKMTNFILKNL